MTTSKFGRKSERWSLPRRSGQRWTSPNKSVSKLRFVRDFRSFRNNIRLSSSPLIVKKYLWFQEKRWEGLYRGKSIFQIKPWYAIKQFSLKKWLFSNSKIKNRKLSGRLNLEFITTCHFKQIVLITGIFTTLSSSRAQVMIFLIAKTGPVFFDNQIN